MRELATYLVGLAIACLAAGGCWAAGAPTPGHFAGKAYLTPLLHDCKDRAGHPVKGTRCPLTRDGRQLWAVAGAARFAPGGSLAGDVISLQPGTVTDLASIPRLVSNVYPPDGPWAQAALFHDLCYQTKGAFIAWGRPGHTRAAPYSRAECDELLRQGMVALGIGTLQRVTIYEAVRLGGGNGWGK